MGLSLLPSLLWGTLLCLMLHMSRRLDPIGIDEEAGHALALQRRGIPCRERSQNPPCATASVLGSGEVRIHCRILKLSRAGMQIEVPLAIPLGEQINVAWENQFFVGAVSSSTAQQDCHVLALQLISSNQ